MSARRSARTRHTMNPERSEWNAMALMTAANNVCSGTTIQKQKRNEEAKKVEATKIASATKIPKTKCLS